METIHLVDLMSRNQIIKKQLKDKQVLFNERFQSVDQTFYKSTSDPTRLFKAKTLVQKSLNEFTLLKSVLEYEDLINQALRFLDLLDRYQIPLENLPTNTELNTEKTKLIKLLGDHVHRPYMTLEKLDANIIVHPFYQELYHKRLLKNYKTVQNPMLKPKINAYKGLNRRQEVTIALNLINERQPKDALIICGDQKYINELRRQERLLNKELSFLNESKSNPLLSGYYYLIEAFINSSMDSFTCFLDFNPLKIKNVHSLINAIKLYQIDFKDFLNSFIELDFNEYTIFQSSKYQEKQYLLAKESYQSLMNKIKQIQTSSLHELLNSSFKLFSHHQDIFTLQALLQDLLPFITPDNCLELLANKLLKPVSKSPTLSDYLVVDSTYQAPYPFELCIYLGLSQKNYPNFKSMNGLYSENYVELIEGFPSLIERIEFHQQQLFSFLHCSHELIITAPIIDYEGKSSETPFEIDDYLKSKNIDYERIILDESLGIDNPIDNLSPELSKKLFLKDDQLVGSISSFEVFFNNSYQYFIQQGLKVRDELLIDLNVQTVGSISHYVLENLVRQYEKNYYMYPQQIETYLNHYKGPLIKLYPHKQDYYEFVFNRLKKSLSLTLSRLSKLEKVSNLEPHLDTLEYQYQYFQLFEDLPVYLNGFIDRIDQNENEYVIYDYKSSFKSLQKKKLLNGQQLQLMTYAFVVLQLFLKECRGVYYINLKEGYERFEPYRYLVKTALEKNELPLDKPLSGYTFNLDSNSPYVDMIQGLRVLKTTGELNNIQSIKEYEIEFYYLYKVLLDNLVIGNITRTKVDDTYFYYKDHERISNWFDNNQSIEDEITTLYKLEENNQEVDDDNI